MATPDPEALRAAADERIRQQITAAANKRTSRKAKRAARTATRTAGLAHRHTQRLQHWSNTTPAATAA
ncbi:hypothetical protein BX265_2344 [Streptomyces sp. TLI_235]|nr:hypothetical protein [Streptomyces sp. TLI_235]PBC77593.1 hypothetical protein BX265_2344 [Streptomyces sp. TLI_235]